MKFATLAALATVCAANDFVFEEDAKEEAPEIFEEEEDVDVDAVVLADDDAASDAGSDAPAASEADSDADDLNMADLEDISLTMDEMTEAYGEDEAVMSNFKAAYPQCRMFRNQNTGAVYLSMLDPSTGFQ